MVNNLLSIGSILSSFGSIVIAILILLFTITVHEFGHYIVGKIFKFKINEFAIGMGPAIYKKVKKSGEIFSIRIFPLGGYCAFEGEDQDETIQAKKANAAIQADGDDTENKKMIDSQRSFIADKHGDLTPAPPQNTLSKDSFNNKKPYQRILVLIAGASVNFIVAILIVVLNFSIFGHSSLQVRELRGFEGGNESAAYNEASLKQDDILLSLNGKYLYISTDLITALNGQKKGDLVDVEVLREGERVSTRVMLRNDVNCQSLTDYLPVFTALGVATVPLIATENSPLSTNQYLLRFNDVPGDYFQCTRIYDIKSFCDYISTYSGAEMGIWMTTSDVGNAEGKELININLNTNAWLTLDKSNPEAVCQFFGITGSALSYQLSSKNIRLSFGEMTYRPIVYGFKTVDSTFKAFGQLFSGKLPITDLSGPVSTISVTSSYVKYGLSYILEIAALIGISVAIFNLLPIPALDGARVVFVVIEWIRKKPINRKIEGMIHAVGLISLLLFAIFVDVIKLFI